MTTQRDREIYFPHIIPGAIAAALITAVCRAFVLPWMLGPDAAKPVSQVLALFLVGYLAMAVAPAGGTPLPWLSAARLKSGLTFGGVAGLLILVMDRFWP